ncbi:hypothetical protein CLIB1444_02S10308 [[Candida] jaroonii]|uniref:Uncharacterized protein n=1 Tax=[Candida] jaroonii TaxID=467808 RepID=A0ACA9Y3M7_9ASCO|nr:hypothetical protein CLIB1444_02S10308 [[Candida] jaroonii]
MPYAAKLATYNYEKQNKKEQRTSKKVQQPTYGYQPPDEVLQNQDEPQAKSSGIKKITIDDIPIKMRVNHPTLKRRSEKLDTDRNPNNYDYDLDDLINERDEPEIEQPQKPFSKEIV